MVVTIKDADGTSVNLTDYTIDFVVTEKGVATALFGGSLTPDADQVTNLGQCSYRLLESDTLDKDPALYDLELRIVDDTGNDVTYSPLVDGSTFGTFEIVQSKAELYDDLPEVIFDGNPE